MSQKYLEVNTILLKFHLENVKSCDRNSADPPPPLLLLSPLPSNKGASNAATFILRTMRSPSAGVPNSLLLFVQFQNLFCNTV